MEFADAAMGLWGFIVFFAIYALVMGVFYSIYTRIKKRKKAKKTTQVSIEEKREPISNEPAEEPAIYRSRVKKTNKFKK